MGYASERFRQKRLAKHAPAKPPYRVSWGGSLSAITRAVMDGPDPALKGKLNGNCNREACQRPGATWFNTSTRAYYCRRCARDINDLCVRYGDHLLLFESQGAEVDAAVKFGEVL